MAKRRNLKKEKALRNQAYARKFRKRSNSRYGRRFFNNNRNESENESSENKPAGENNAGGGTGAADTV